MVELNRRALLAMAAATGISAAMSAKAQAIGGGWTTPDPDDASRWLYLQPAEAAFLIAAADRIIPQDEFPSGSQAGVIDYIDLQLATDWGQGEGLYLEGPFHPEEATATQGYQLRFTPAELYRHAIAALGQMLDTPFHELSSSEQDRVLRMLESGKLGGGDTGSGTGDPGPASAAGGGSDGSSGEGGGRVLMLGEVPAATFFDHLLRNANEGYFADPIHGGNVDMIGWRMVGFPGADAYYTDLVDKHGMEYFRPPAGVAAAASGSVTSGATADGGPQPVRGTRGTR